MAGACRVGARTHYQPHIIHDSRGNNSTTTKQCPAPIAHAYRLQLIMSEEGSVLGLTYILLFVCTPTTLATLIMTARACRIYSQYYCT